MIETQIHIGTAIRRPTRTTRAPHEQVSQRTYAISGVSSRRYASTLDSKKNSWLPERPFLAGLAERDL